MHQLTSNRETKAADTCFVIFQIRLTGMFNKHFYKTEIQPILKKDNIFELDFSAICKLLCIH